MKKNEVLVLFKAIEEAIKVDGSVKYKYLLIKNKQSITNEIESLQGIEKEISECIKDFLTKKDNLIYKYSEDGEIKQDSDKFPEFKEEYIKLIEEYKTDIELYESKMKDFNITLLDEEADEFKIYPIDIDMVPEINSDILEVLMKYKLIV